MAGKVRRALALAVTVAMAALGLSGVVAAPEAGGSPREDGVLILDSGAIFPDHATLFDAADGSVADSHDFPSPGMAAVWAPTGERLAVFDGATVTVYDYPGWNVAHSFTPTIPSGGALTQPAFDDSGSRLAYAVCTASSTCYLGVVDMVSGVHELVTIFTGASQPWFGFALPNIAWVGTGATARIATGESGGVRTYDPEPPYAAGPWVLETPGLTAQGILLAPDGTKLAVLTSDFGFTVYDVDAGFTVASDPREPLASIKPPGKALLAGGIDWAPDGERLVASVNMAIDSMWTADFGPSGLYTFTHDGSTVTKIRESRGLLPSLAAVGMGTGFACPGYSGPFLAIPDPTYSDAGTDHYVQAVGQWVRNPGRDELVVGSVDATYEPCDVSQVSPSGSASSEIGTAEPATGTALTSFYSDSGIDPAAGIGWASLPRPVAPAPPQPPVVSSAAVASPPANVTTDPEGSGGLVIRVDTSSAPTPAITVQATLACPAGDPNSVTGATLHTQGGDVTMFELEGGVWEATIPAYDVVDGPVTVTVTGCSVPTSDAYLGTIVLYDPSGFVTDAVTDLPIEGAEVTLWTVPGWTDPCPDAPTSLGVAPGPGTYDPAVNPQSTDANGHYGWDVAAGCWFVTVTAAGYDDATSRVVGVPPEVTDLDVELTPTAVPDTTAPEIVCDPVPSGWSPSDVSVHCTASDSGSGLADPGDASFDLTTSVAAGSEDPAAMTVSNEVCDIAGNCATAGPLGPVQVDKQAPTVSCPAAPTAWNSNNVTLDCTGSDGGSGPASQPVSLSTSVAAGTETAAAATDSASLCDAVGNCATAGPISPIKVDRKAPTITVTTPTPGQHVAQGAAVNSVVSCTDLGAGVPAGGCSYPAALDTATAGTENLHVDAVDLVGNTSTADLSFIVDPVVAAGDWVSVAFSGNTTYSNAASATAGNVTVTKFANGRIKSVLGTITIPSKVSGNASVGFNVNCWTFANICSGNVTVSDVAAGLYRQTPAFFVAVNPVTGANPVPGAPTPYVKAARATLPWFGWTLNFAVDDRA